MALNPPLELALIGTGNRSQTTYAPLFNYLQPWVRLVAVCDPVKGECKPLCGCHEGARLLLAGGPGQGQTHGSRAGGGASGHPSRYLLLPHAARHPLPRRDLHEQLADPGQRDGGDGAALRRDPTHR